MAQFPGGRYVTNDGVHVYRDWAVVHEDLMASRHEDRSSARGRSRGAGESEDRNRQTRIGGHGRQGILRAAHVAAQIFHLAAGPRSGQAISGYQPEDGTGRRGGPQRRGEIADSARRPGAGIPGSASSPWIPRGWIWPCFYSAISIRISPWWTIWIRPRRCPRWKKSRRMAKRENPDLQAANSALRAAKLDIAIARQGYLPTLDGRLRLRHRSQCVRPAQHRGRRSRERDRCPISATF